MPVHGHALNSSQEPDRAAFKCSTAPKLRRALNRVKDVPVSPGFRAGKGHSWQGWVLAWKERERT